MARKATWVRTLVALAIVAACTGCNRRDRQPDQSTNAEAAPVTTPALFWCQKEPTITDVRVCVADSKGCEEYSGGGDCFSQTGAWCTWRAGPDGTRASLCTATRDECQRNYDRIPKSAEPVPCFEAKDPKEVE